ncbi:MAG: hypothetical protein AAFU73_13740 [Planctomycetota bacterium]
MLQRLLLAGAALTLAIVGTSSAPAAGSPTAGCAAAPTGSLVTVISAAISAQIDIPVDDEEPQKFPRTSIFSAEENEAEGGECSVILFTCSTGVGQGGDNFYCSTNQAAWCSANGGSANCSSYTSSHDTNVCSASGMGSCSAKNGGYCSHFSGPGHCSVIPGQGGVCTALAPNDRQCSVQNIFGIGSCSVRGHEGPNVPGTSLCAGNL